MKRTIARLALALAAATAGLTFAVPSMAAHGDCDKIVVDQAGVLGGQADDVEAQAKSLSSAIGAEVRVRTYSNINVSTLDQYEPARVAECSSWQNGRGQRKGNLLEFMVSTNPNRLGVYYGEEWKGALESGGNANRIKSGAMQPKFKQRDFSGGFINAMAESQRVIDAYQHPSTGSGNGPTVVNNNKPADLTGLWWVLGGLLLLALLGAAGLFGWRFIKDRRDENDRRETARNRALTAKQAAARAISGFDGSRQAVLTAKLNQFGLKGDPDGDKLREQHDVYVSKLAAASQGMSDSGTSAGNPEAEDLATGVYNQLANSFEAILNDANAAVNAAAEVDRLAEVVKKKLEALPKAIAVETAAIKSVRAIVAVMRAQGFNDESLTAIETGLGAAEENLNAAKAAGTTPDALRLVTSATKSIDEAAKAAAELTKCQNDLLAGADKIAQRIAGLTAKVEPARAAFMRIKDGHPDNVWESIQGNGTEADNRIRLAEAGLLQLRTLSDMQHQQWAEAEALLAEIYPMLNEANSLLDSVTALESKLIDAQNRADEEIRLAEADLAKAQMYERRYDDDVDDSHKGELREAERLLGEARRAHGADKPDYLKVVELALKANAAADRILELAMSEVEAADRLRRQAASTLTAADEAVDKAERYVDNHKRDVDSDTEDLVSTAKGHLTQAKNAQNPSEVLNQANKAKSKAEKAYKDAKNDVRRREDAREDARRARERSTSTYGSSSNDDLLTGVIIGSSLGHQDHSWGSTVNVNNDWGSNSGGGGGSDTSFDFGGGDSGGGGGSDMGF